MTKEQEKAIENLKDLLRQRNEKQVQITTYDLFGNIETVLSMLKEKDKEIEHWKNGFERELEDNRKNTCELLRQDLVIRKKDKQIEQYQNMLATNDMLHILECEKKDKQIDLMARAFKQDDVRTVEEIIEYFTELVAKE